MNEVFVMRHGGILCAFPARRLVTVTDHGARPPTLRLWGFAGDDSSTERLVGIRTGHGPQWVTGTEPALAELSPGSVEALPQVIRDAVGLPFIVGVGTLPDHSELVWLIEPQKISAPTDTAS